MVKTYIPILIVFLTLSSATWGKNKSPESLVKTYDLRTYSPVKFDLKDLVFTLKSDEITKQVKKLIATADIKDVSFTFYWMFPGKAAIEVNGLPNGFERIKTNLKNMVLQRLDFIIPQKLGNTLRSYKLSLAGQKGDRLLVLAKDKTNIKTINEIKLHFIDTGMLKKIETSSPAGYESFEKDMSTKSWSHNKWVLDELKVITISGLKKTATNYKLDYGKVAGMGFVKEIEISTVSEMQFSDGKEVKKNRVEDFQTVEFSNYKVNEGLARNYFRKQKKE
jgi:hypothetical protein